MPKRRASRSPSPIPSDDKDVLIGMTSRPIRGRSGNRLTLMSVREPTQLDVGMMPVAGELGVAGIEGRSECLGQRQVAGVVGGELVP